jgi:histidine kinase/DNA gyrase B/HSP90-like ATPase
MAAEAGRARGHVWLPTGVVIVALLAPAFLPWVVRWKENTIARELQEVGVARPLAAARRPAFERTISTRAAYLISRNPSFLERTAQWQAQHDLEAKKLAAAAVWLGPEARAQLAVLDRNDDALRRGRRERDQRPLTPEEEFRDMPAINARAEALLADYDRLDAALLAEGDKWQAELDRFGRIGWFTNLVGNAVKFTPPGGTITMVAEAEDGAVRFRVSDTGTGIRPEHVPHLFDRFWQATRTDRRGLGLGLPIVKGLVEAHGSRIVVTSTVGLGTTFSFSIRRQC